ncbi:MAG: cobyrinic acid a,c-diamide synthase [Cyanobacteriota bacterium]|jgi:cobyrinic acid a,c-diamide synthase
MTLIIAGERSGAGKTTLTLAMLAYLAQHQEPVQSFKVGPDYIDPMFHSHITGRPCRNLDPILTSEAYVQRCFAYHATQTRHSLIEGVMGLFDGIPYQGIADYASTAHIARLLKIPVVLVVDCRSLSGSIAAIVQGYRHFHPDVDLAGVILNKIGSDRHQQLLITALEPLQIPVLGCFFRHQTLALPDRHLGLVPCGELPQIDDYFKRLAHLAAQQLDWPTLLPLLKTPSTLASLPDQFPIPSNLRLTSPVKLAIAQDQAFNFYYADNLDLLQSLGAELVPFSPLDTEHLPAIDGLYLGGGFPELFAEPLSLNHPLKKHLITLIRQGLPTYAECGGLIYLCQSLTTFTDETVPMLGLLPTAVHMTPKLSLGYRHVDVLPSHSWLNQKTRLTGHEFHRSTLSQSAPNPLYRQQGLLPNDSPHHCGWFAGNLQAAYLHLHWGDCPSLVANLLTDCLAFQKKLSYIDKR